MRTQRRFTRVVRNSPFSPLEALLVLLLSGPQTVKVSAMPSRGEKCALHSGVRGSGKHGGERPHLYHGSLPAEYIYEMTQDMFSRTNEKSPQSQVWCYKPLL